MIRKSLIRNTRKFSSTSKWAVSSSSQPSESVPLSKKSATADTSEKPRSQVKSSIVDPTTSESATVNVRDSLTIPIPIMSFLISDDKTPKDNLSGETLAPRPVRSSDAEQEEDAGRSRPRAPGEDVGAGR
jgi:hypothetical protein